MLYFHVIDQRLDLVQHLVEKGIDINCRNSPKSEIDRFCWISF